VKPEATPQKTLMEPQPPPEPEPYQPHRLPEGTPPWWITSSPPWKLFMCQATCPPWSPDTYVLTASATSKGAAVSMQPKMVPTDARQLWRLGEQGHLICQGGEFCVDIDGQNRQEGAKVIMWDVNLPHPDYPIAKNQLWVHATGGTYKTILVVIAQRSLLIGPSCALSS
jgi:hypothetical protein